MLDDDFEAPQRTSRAAKFIIGLLAVGIVLLAGMALRAAAPVVVPLAYAFFITLLVRPLQLKLDRRLPDGLRWLSVAACLLLIILVLAAIVGGVWMVLDMVSEEVPKYFEHAKQAWSHLSEAARARGVPMNDLEIQPGTLSGWVASGFGSVGAALTGLVLVLFFVLLMLLESANWQNKVRRAFNGDQSSRVIHSVGLIAQKARQYLATRFAISVISGVAAGLWLWAVGVDFPYLWALLTFLLNFVPNIGSIIAVIPPTLIALAQYGFAWAMVALLGLGAIEQVIGNFLDPRLQGRNLDISPLVVLVAVIFWGWLWGVAGALLAVPLTVTIIIAAAHVPRLRPLALMLCRTQESDIPTQAA